MASYHAIAATGQAILGVLADACPRQEFGGAVFELYQAADLKEPMEDGISLYLYRVAVSGARRNLPPRTTPDGRRLRPPLPLDLYFLMTAWARTAARQQRLLGWAMRALEDTPVLGSGVLNHYCPEPDTFLSHESVELVCDAASLQDIVNIWEPHQASQQLSATYVARMVAIDSSLELVEGAPVQTRIFEHAEVVR